MYISIKPTYLLNRKLKGTKPEDLSLHNRITIDETQRRLKEEKIKNDNKSKKKKKIIIIIIIIIKIFIYLFIK